MLLSAAIDKVRQAAHQSGYVTYRRGSATGSVYINCWLSDRLIHTVRLATHSARYGQCTISVDPRFEETVEAAIKELRDAAAAAVEPR